MRRRIWKTLWVLILIAIMVLPPLRAAQAAGFNYYTSIYVHKKPDKMEYEVGESFKKGGMEIYGNRVKTDGTQDQVQLSIDNITVDPKQFTKAGQIKVEITLKAMAESGNMEPFSTSFYVTVRDPEEGDPPLYWVKSISAEAKKTVYLVGDSFDKSGLKVWAYSEGDYPPEDAKWDCTKYVTKISPTKFKKAGTQYVKVTANLTTQHSTADFTAKIKVKVYNKIEITKQPGAEKVKAGGACNFTVKDKYAESYEWFFVKGNDVVPVKEKNDRFPGLKVSGAHEKKLKLSNIPIELDGWSVMCEFSNPAHSIESDTALITVTGKGTAAVTPETTPEPKDVPTETPGGESPTETPFAPPPIESPDDPVPGPTAAPHTHSFDGVYRWDSKQHWLECACGERTGAAAHVVTEWKTEKEPSKDAPGVRKGRCAVCGAEVAENIPYEGGEDSMQWLLYAGIGLAGAAILGCVAGVIVMVTKGSRTKKKTPENPEE